MTTYETHEAEWQATLTEHFPEITDEIQLLHLHRAYMLGYQAGMTWMKECCYRNIATTFAEAAAK